MAPRWSASRVGSGRRRRRSLRWDRSAGSTPTRDSSNGWASDGEPRALASDMLRLPRFFGTAPPSFRLVGERVLARPPERGDWEEWAALCRRDRQPRLLGRRALRAPRLHDRGASTHPCLCLPALAAASGRGGLPAAQRAEPRAVAQERLPRGGLCARVSLHRRPLAGPRALRDAAGGMA